MDQTIISGGSSPNDDDIEEIVCITPYSAEEIHARAREKTKTPTKDAKKGEKIIPHKTSASVTIPLSINEIHSQAQAKLTNNNSKVQSSYRKTPQRLSLNYKKNTAVFSATNKKTNAINSSLMIVDSDRESSPEIMIIREVIKSEVPSKTIKTPTPLKSKSVNSVAVLTDISCALHEKKARTTSSEKITETTGSEKKSQTTGSEKKTQPTSSGNKTPTTSKEKKTQTTGSEEEAPTTRSEKEAPFTGSEKEAPTTGSEKKAQNISNEKKTRTTSSEKKTPATGSEKKTLTTGSEKKAQRTSSKAKDTIICNSKKVSTLSTQSTVTKPVELTTPVTPTAKPASTSNTNQHCRSKSPSSSQVKTNYTTKPLINLSYSSRPSTVSLPGPATSHSPWTPHRLLSDTPQKVEETVSPIQIKPSPSRGVKRLLEDDSDTSVAKIPKVSPSKNEDLSKMEKSLPKYEYLKVFKLILTDVWSCDKNMHLFDARDLEIFSLFEALSEGAKALYVQLLKMKHQWRRVPTLKYDDISPNLLPVIKELVVQNFLQESPDSWTDLHTMLDLLIMPELKKLMQKFHVPVTGRKQTVISALINYGKNQCSIAPTARGSPVKKNLLSIITTEVQRVLGNCVRLQPEVADALQRVCILGSLPSCFRDENLGTTIFRIYYALRELTIYPNIQVHRATIIFKNKESLLKFHKSFNLLLEVNKFTIEKNWNDAIRIAHEAWIMFKELQNNKEAREHDQQLPEFLRRFSAGDVLAKVLNVGLDAMGRRKQYAVMVELLRDLLNQQIYKTRHRGLWYERLALILFCHVKQNNEAAEVVIQAMADTKVHLISKVGLAIRATMILERKWKPQASLKQTLTELSVSLVKEPFATTIQAKYRGGQGQGLKLDYIHEGTDGSEVIVSSVEELAISHYKRKEGFTEGVHAEGTLILSLFGILFWDVIYDHYVPDVFLTKYQDCPLDLSSNEFYTHRQNAIENRLDEILKWGDTEAQVFVQGMWEQHVGKLSVVSWKIFRDVQQAQDLLLCIGMKTMAGICKRLCKEHGMARSGFPDLLLWKPGLMKNCKFVEVKGPNDKLSNKQRVWIDYLMKIGAQVEVCHVETKSAKYLGGVTNGC